MLHKFLFAMGLLLVACQPDPVEVTRVVTEVETVVFIATETSTPTPTVTPVIETRIVEEEVPVTVVVTATSTDTPEPSPTMEPTATATNTAVPTATAEQVQVQVESQPANVGFNWSHQFDEIGKKTTISWSGSVSGNPEVHFWLSNTDGRCAGSKRSFFDTRGEIFVESSCSDAQLTVQVRQPNGQTFDLLFEETRSVGNPPVAGNNGGKSPVSTNPPPTDALPLP